VNARAELSSPDREHDPHALPDVEIFEMTAAEIAAEDEDTCHEYLKEFPLAVFNSRERERMLDAMIERVGIKGGFFWWSRLPGCLPESEARGPFDSQAECVADIREEYGEWE
jgi:hypothetical protein